MLIDTEMYESDETNYPGPCVCDDCFAEYLKTYADDWQTLYNQIPADRRGLWLAANGATEHYARHQAKRIEAQYDKIRERCQKINPTFLFGHAPLLGHLPGLERGLGTSSVPCLVFSEREYSNGPSSQSFANVQRIRQQGIPALYIPGAFLVQQSPEKVETSALISSLYCDGWWLYYATALLTHPAADDPEAFDRSYGRVRGTSARDYLDRITAVHQRLDRLLKEPRENWPRPAQLPSPPVAEIHHRAGAIAIDGELDDPAWQHATQLELTVSRWGDPTGPPTTVWTCWDEQAFYVAARCQLPKDTALYVPQRGRDNGSMWQFDGIELFLDPGKSTTRYAHFVISALGDVYDALVSPEVGGSSGNPIWNINVEAAATHTDAEYRVETKIPFAGWADTPKSGDVWGANFCRFRPSEQTWSPTYAGFHTPTRFGTLTFR